jgi:four helix bundle protein
MFPKEETYSLTDQIRRSSRSVGAHLAEAWGKRRYEKHFVMILTGASAELNETIHWIHTSYKCNYISKELCTDMLDHCHKIKGLIGGMRKKASQFSDA